MTKKIVKRTDANNETLYFYTHSDAVDVGEGSSTKSLTEVIEDTLHKSAQTLTNAEKTQVHANLGTESFVGDRAVRYDEAQVLGSSEKTQALTNLGLNGIDEYPTKNSTNMVRSGGVYEELALGTVYDVSAKNPTAGHNNDGKWESLSVLLSDANLNTLIPTAVRKGGMSIKFVQSSDNKYVQFRLMHPLDNPFTAAADFTNVENWQGVDLKPTFNSHNLVESGGVYDAIPDIKSYCADAISENIFNKDTMADVFVGVYVDTNGFFGKNSSSMVSKRIPIKPDTVYFSYGITDKTYACIVDSDDNWLYPLAPDGSVRSYYIIYPNTNFKTPSNAAFLYITTTFLNVSYKDDISIYEGETNKGYIQFNKKVVYSQLPNDLLERINNKADLIKEVLGRNLFNKNALVRGYIDTSGNIIPNTGNYFCSSLIPVKPNTVYYVTYPTGLTKRYGRFVDENGNPLKALRPDTGAAIGRWDLNSSRAVLSPQGAKYFQFTVIFNGDSDLDTAQFELGGTPTQHVPYEEKNVLDPNELPHDFTELEDRVDELENGFQKNNILEANFGSQISSIVSDFNDTSKFKSTVLLNNTYRNKHFNFLNYYLVNKQTNAETLVKGANDDICPVEFLSTYLGANHGLNIEKVSASNNDKTFADIGSIWSDGTHQFTLIKVEQNYLYFVGENRYIYPSFSFEVLQAKGILTHVSGATHEGSVSYTTKSTEQWIPYISKDPDISVYADDEKITENGQYRFNVLKVSEDYDILNPASVIERVKAGVGTFTDNPVAQDFSNVVDKMFHIGNVYTFNSAHECFVSTSICLFQRIENFGHFGFTQSATLAYNDKCYIPKAKSKNNGADAVDFRTIVNSNVSNGLIRPDDYEVPNLPPDRIITWSNNIGIHIGYLFDYGVGGNNRLGSLPGDIAIYISNTYKLYPYGWCASSQSVPDAYSNKSAVCFRKFIDRAKINSNGVISTSVFEYNGHCYIYADFNAVGEYEIEIPAKFQGGQIEVLEKRDNVSLLTQNASKKILLKVVSDSVMYGYFVGKI